MTGATKCPCVQKFSLVQCCTTPLSGHACLAVSRCSAYFLPLHLSRSTGSIALDVNSFPDIQARTDPRTRPMRHIACEMRQLACEREFVAECGSLGAMRVSWHGCIRVNIQMYFTALPSSSLRMSCRERKRPPWVQLSYPGDTGEVHLIYTTSLQSRRGGMTKTYFLHLGV